jgi:hypothetical protein
MRDFASRLARRRTVAENPSIAASRLDHVRAVLAWVLLAGTLLLAAGTLALAIVDGRWDDAAVLIPAAAFAGVGSLVASRRSGNPIGWLFGLVGVTLATAVFATAYGYHSLLAEPDSLPGGTYAAFVGANIWTVAFFAGVLILLLFPTGTPPSPRWRPLVWLQGVGLVVYGVGVTTPEMLTEPFEQVENPLRIPGAPEALEYAAPAGWFILLPSLLLAAVALVVRYRRSGAVERQQLKLVASTGVFFALAFAVESVSGDTGSGVFEEVAGALAIAALTTIPVAAGVAILRYRLYDIDLLVRRTLVYGVATAGLAGLYFGIVLLLQQVFSSFAGGSDLAVAVSTLAVAALFGPARRRVQRAVDRRFYRRRYDAQLTLEGFAAHLRDEVDLHELRVELSRVVEETMQPAHVSLWLRQTGVG